LPTRSDEIEINNQITEQLNTFNYLGNLVTYEKEKDTGNRVTKVLTITGIINNTFKPNNVQKGIRVELCNTTTILILLYDRENWTVKSKDKSRLKAAEMKFMRQTAKYTRRDHKTNERILNELKVTSILDKITSYKNEWIQHINRMPRSILPNLLKMYAPRGI
jgi:hypothetical protein